MRLETKIREKFDSLGSDITVFDTGNNQIDKTKGFIQPISYRGSKYYDFENTDVSSNDNIRYLLLCKSDANIKGSNRLGVNGVLYSVIRCESYFFKNKCIYKWAILKMYYQKQEDDFIDIAQQ